MDKTTVILMLCCMSCSTVLSQLVLDIYGAQQNRLLPEGDGLAITCYINKGLELVLEYRVHWIHKPMVSAGSEEDRLTNGKLLVDKNKHSANYDVELKFDNTVEQTNVTLYLKDAKPSMDGKYICRAVSLDETQESKTLEKEVIVTVPANVQYVQMDFDHEEVRSAATVVVERDEGEYGVSCSAGGSNPSVTLQLYLGDNPVEAPPSGRDGRDEAAEEASGARRFQNSLSLTNVNLSAADNGKTLKCVAKAEFEGAVEKIASIPLQIIALEPVIECDTNASSRPGDKYVKLTCRVNHARVEVKSYSFEIDQTNEIITLDKDSPNHHAVYVENVEGMEDTDDVTLMLYVAEDIHFDSHYYLDVELKNDQKFRHRIDLRERESSGGSFKAAAYALCLLMSVLVWSL